MSLKLSKITIEPIWQFLDTPARHHILAGSRSSGKTMTVAMYVLFQLSTKFPNSACLVVREVFTNLSGSIYEDFLEAAKILGLSHKIKRRITPLELRLSNGSVVMFRGLSDAGRLKGIKKSGKKIRYLVIEEAQNIEDGDAVQTTELTAFRGQKERHTIVIMNTNIKNWVFDTYFAPANFLPDPTILEQKGIMTRRYRKKEAFIDYNLLYCSIYVNKFLKKEDIQEFLRLKETYMERYQIDALGMWGSAEGAIYADYIKFINYEDLDQVDDIHEFTFGIDYGEKNTATVVLAAAYSKDYSKIYFLDYAYHCNIQSGIFLNSKGLEEMVVALIEKIVTHYKVSSFIGIVDSACNVFRENIIATLMNKGYQNFSVFPTQSKNGRPGKFPILDRIHLFRTVLAEGKIYFNKSVNWNKFIFEMERAVWDDNKTIPTRLDANNDCLDALEYFLCNRYWTLAQSKLWKKKEEIDNEKILSDKRLKIQYSAPELYN